MAAGGKVVAVVGATSLLGSELLTVLEDSSLGVVELRPLVDAADLETSASVEGEGEDDEGVAKAAAPRIVEFRDEEFPVRVASPEAFDGCDAVFLVGDPEQAGRLAKIAFLRTACTIDLSGRFARDEDVPLVLPEINAGALAALPARSLVAVPDAATAMVALALAPLHRLAGLRAVYVSTYESASGHGRTGMDELGQQIRALFNYQSVDAGTFPKALAFNCIPQVDAFEPSGYTRSESALARGVARLLDARDLVVGATRAWVPVFSGNSASVIVETGKSVDVTDVRKALEEGTGLALVDDPGEGEYPLNGEVVGEDRIAVGRVRALMPTAAAAASAPAAAGATPDAGTAPGTRFAFWIAADNLRRGAVLSAVQVAEAVLAR